jgi:PleD family two-component response regulator
MDENKTIILAIDDDAQQLREYKEFLVPQFDLRVVKAASDALSFLNSNKVDLILLDIGMPNISGIEFLEDIRKIPSYMDVPIIIVSGNTNKTIFDEAKNNGVFDVLIKPVKQTELISTMEKALQTA